MSLADGLTVVYDMRRGGKTMAQVVTLRCGKCVVSWPTSTIVYDSEEDARAVHISHMGGRGEPTDFVPMMSDSADFMRGVDNAMQDSMENASYATLGGGNDPQAKLRCPDWETLNDREAFVRGYMAQAACCMTPRDDMEVDMASDPAGGGS